MSKINTENNEWEKENEKPVKVNQNFIGEIFINDSIYKIGFKADTDTDTNSQPKSFNELLYKHISKVGCASIVSMYLNELNVNNVALTSVAYLFGEKLFPIFISNYTIKYMYQYYLS